MGRGTLRRTLVAVLVAVLLVGTAGASVWLMASSGVLSLGGDRQLPGAPENGGQNAGGVTIPAAGGFRVAQPRDPFAPLITSPTSTTVPDGSTTTGGGSTTTTTGGGSTTSTTGGGSTTTTTSGGSTTTTTSDTPTGKRVSLLEIRDESGVKKAVLTVDGQTYTVGVGDTFATDFKVISLATSSGVFMYRDSVFTLAVGQSIIK
ncbi:MAG: hypothetical protein MUE66_08540 [Acidimicrobiia bacterium]|jgi:hypothetical protein|nr:hypothetical protein [Acidimicrobiia bacterium]